MNVSVHFGAAVFEEVSDGLKAGKNGLRISRCGRMRGSRQAFPYLRRILMQNENRKKVSNQHSYEDEADTTKSEQSPRTQRRKYFRLRLRKSLQCSCFLLCAHGIARTPPGFPQFNRILSVAMLNAAAL